MRVGSLAIEGFRNLRSERLELGARNLLVGPNGAGKTSVLEALAVALHGRSFRALDQQVWRGRDSDIWRVEASVELRSRGTTHRVAVAGGTRYSMRATIDGQAVPLAELMRRFPLVVFVPEDREIVVGAPSMRRDYLDQLGSQARPGYQQVLRTGQRVLRQRQNLIRHKEIDELTLEVFDARLAEASSVLAVEREELIGQLVPIVNELVAMVAGQSFEVGLRYQRSWEGDPLGALTMARKVDIARQSTSIGFHRDDLAVSLRGMDARQAASQGEVKLLAIALRLAGARVLQAALGEPPVVALDDLVAELDADRSGRVLEVVGELQCLVTQVDRELAWEGVQVWSASNGHLEVGAV
jgi:DNA replication and repair protein RecF